MHCAGAICILWPETSSPWRVAPAGIVDAAQAPEMQVQALFTPPAGHWRGATPTPGDGQGAARDTPVCASVFAPRFAMPFHTRRGALLARPQRRRHVTLPHGRRRRTPCWCHACGSCQKVIKALAAARLSPRNARRQLSALVNGADAVSELGFMLLIWLSEETVCCLH